MVIAMIGVLKIVPFMPLFLDYGKLFSDLYVFSYSIFHKFMHIKISYRVVKCRTSYD
jgi:hypothetical protein